jgi:hypothetical protein
VIELIELIELIEAIEAIGKWYAGRSCGRPVPASAGGCPAVVAQPR